MVEVGQLTNSEKNMSPRQRVDSLLGKESLWTPEFKQSLDEAYDILAQQEPVKVELAAALGAGGPENAQVIKAITCLFIAEAFTANRYFQMKDMIDVLNFNDDPHSLYYGDNPNAMSPEQKAEIKKVIAEQQHQLIDFIVTSLHARFTPTVTQS